MPSKRPHRGRSVSRHPTELSVCNESVIRVIFSLEILSLYWNSLPFRGGSIVALPIHCKLDKRIESRSTPVPATGRAVALGGPPDTRSLSASSTTSSSKRLVKEQQRLELGLLPRHGHQCWCGGAGAMLGGVAGARGLWCSRGGLAAQRALLSTAAGARPTRRRQLAPRKAAMTIVRHPLSVTEHVPVPDVQSLTGGALSAQTKAAATRIQELLDRGTSVCAHPTPSCPSPLSHAVASFPANSLHSPLVAYLQPGAQGIQLGVKQRGCNGLSTPSLDLLDLVHTITSSRVRRLPRV